jgi:transposase
VVSTAEKKIWGRKRAILVDTQGFLLAVLVHAANIGDRDGARLLLQKLTGRFPRLSHLFADHGYTGPLLDWIKAHLGWQTEIVSKPENDAPHQWEWEAVLIDGQMVPRPKRKDRGFQVQPQRWKVERTLGWLIRFRRLARDYEGLPSSSEALIQIASIRLFLTRLTPFRAVGT